MTYYFASHTRPMNMNISTILPDWNNPHVAYMMWTVILKRKGNNRLKFPIWLTVFLLLWTNAPLELTIIYFFNISSLFQEIWQKWEQIQVSSWRSKVTLSMGSDSMIPCFRDMGSDKMRVWFCLIVTVTLVPCKYWLTRWIIRTG